ncbi:Alpha/Beta hydrolase protein [Collybia nuda]|uniref:Dipeptidyl-peptidase V n=1 Tax=Collybia nuda TaxID=64659 RepID=A0A9P5YFA1_9AGAR|nr:Alpha/Beta hydrolase protein [Collybia nuda]
MPSPPKTPYNSRTDPRDTPFPEKISNTLRARDLKLSTDGLSVLYQVAPFYKVERVLSEIWLAKVDEPQSARPLTNGLFNDRAPAFHPDGKRILFLSDRHNPGKTLHIYVLDMAEGKSPEPVPLLSSSAKKGVQGFEISPDGNFVAFTSADEETVQAGVEVSDVKVFGGSGSTSGFSRFRIYSFRTGEVTTLRGVREDRQIESATWSPNSKWLLYRLRGGRGPEFAELEVTLESIGVDEEGSKPNILGVYPRSPAGPNLWVSSGHVLSLQNYEPNNRLDARTVFTQRVDNAFTPVAKLKGWERLYGESEDAVRIIDMTPGGDTHGGGVVAVEVCTGVDTRIDIISVNSEGSMAIQGTLFRTHDDAVWFGAWDAKRVVDGDGNTSYVFAGVLSSGIKHEPPNVWAGRVTGEAREIPSKCRLSSHLEWMVEAPAIKTEVIYWNTADGTQLSGLIRYPPAYDASWGPLPTVMFIHGGPYRRDVPDYMSYFCNWREHFAWAGYLVISPNYRGSQGRGHAFAHAASRGIGVYDWPDCESMVDMVIQKGLADPARLGVAGWSHGASLAAWGVTKTKTRFKAAVIGAGASNWEGMVMDSGSPELETEIGQSAPWDHDGREQSIRKTSPIHSVAGVETAVLLLHGEKDERMNVGQAVGLWRGLKRRASERGREGAQLVIYPREPHGFVERKHAEDVLKRVLVYFNTWI